LFACCLRQGLAVWLRQLLEPPASVSQMPTCLAQYYGFVTVVVSNWDLNSGPWACWAATLPLEPLFALGYFLDRVFFSSWAMILLLTASWVAGTTGPNYYSWFILLRWGLTSFFARAGLESQFSPLPPPK
jgi:hypothetical protein